MYFAGDMGYTAALPESSFYDVNEFAVVSGIVTRAYIYIRIDLVSQSFTYIIKNRFNAETKARMRLALKEIDFYFVINW